MERTSQKLKKIGIDVDSVIAKLGGNELLYLSICQKFIKDPSYCLLKTAIGIDDREAVINYAHTLKGMACNLGFTKLSRLCRSVMEVTQMEDKEILDQIYQELSDEYKRIIAALQHKQKA